MARKIETKEFPFGENEIKFRVTQEGFASGRAIFVRVAKALGPGLALLAEGSPSLRSIKFAPAVKSALESLSDADLDFLASKFGASTQFSTDGGLKWPYLGKAEQEEIFGGNLFLFFQWILFALEVNFADFSAALSSLRESGREGATPPDSTGSPRS